MSLNKFMHPRNKYRKPPDFKSLAIKYPEFRKYAKQDISGKVVLDFKNLESVRALTTTLLKEDFNLDVEIPLNRLIPTLPLRLNYLLWIEDILKINGTSDIIEGIDIGCGASCVYPLLAAKNFGWRMLATEVDTESAFIASNNVRRNKLQDMITVKTVKEEVMLQDVLKSKNVYDFCMCNPPFFSSVEELDPRNVARSPSRPEPRNAHSGAPGELVVPGGETAFVEKIIKESLILKERIRIYSVMVGHKTSVNKVKRALQEAGVTLVATTEFCQGRTTRWGICWTLDSAVKLPQVNNVPSTLKSKAPFSYTCDLDLDTTLEKILQIMDQLQITHSSLKNNTEVKAMEITAVSNTWANSRKKRRQEKFKQITSNEVINQINSESEKSKMCETKNICDNNKTDEKDQIQDNVVNIPKYDSKVGDETNNVATTSGLKRSLTEDDGVSEASASKIMKTEYETGESDLKSEKEPYLFASLIVKKAAQGTSVELCWLRGKGGRDAAHQVLQYFKNNLSRNTNL